MPRIWSFILTLAAAIVLLFIGVLVLHPLYVNVCDAAQHGAQQKCEEQHLLYYLFLKGLQVLFHAETWTALATIAIAAFTYTLKRSTDKLWNAGERQFKLAKETTDMQAKEIRDQIDIAREANRAAQKSADAAVATERARFYAVIEHNFLRCIDAAGAWAGPPVQEARPLPMDIQPMAGIRFKNYGKTPGIIIEVATGIIYAEHPPDPVWHVKVVLENIIAANEATDKFGTLIAHPITMAQANKVRNGEGHIWIFGYVSYDDVFGVRQVHRFYQRLICVSQFRYVLQSYDYKHYNHSS